MFLQETMDYTAVHSEECPWKFLTHLSPEIGVCKSSVYSHKIASFETIQIHSCAELNESLHSMSL